MKDTLTIPPHLPTTIEHRYERLLAKIGLAWKKRDEMRLPKLDELGRWPRTRRNATA
jgi:hypothetical protein